MLSPSTTPVNIRWKWKRWAGLHQNWNMLELIRRLWICMSSVNRVCAAGCIRCSTLVCRVCLLIVERYYCAQCGRSSARPQTHPFTHAHTQAHTRRSSALCIVHKQVEQLCLTFIYCVNKQIRHKVSEERTFIAWKEVPKCAFFNNIYARRVLTLMMCKHPVFCCLSSDVGDLLS